MAVMAKKRTPAPPPEPPANPWPARLAGIRALYKLTLDEAAARISAPVSTWNNWEYGRRRPNPMIQRLIELTFPEYFRKK